MSDDSPKKTSEIQPPAGLQESLDLTPVFANLTNVTTAGGITRIAFGEIYGGVGQKYHTSVVLPTQVALEMSKLIQQVVGVHQKRIESEAKNMEPPESIN